ncbi:hypothetical protein PUR31_22885 [Pseudomonas mosselii]|uniref:hypothetical protein n=1 Tax=unclassified Pseudomonas TaxID=196821 RepID=UPI0020C22BBB|nr:MULTISPECIES: hypothetical protein [unclassified Pseudomonas]MCP8635536.1 hypothetical protein [Pseudomonas sp. DVZ6]MDC0690333.1 hypothetical protein [Mitsuaria sp. RG]MDD7786955.1 hypothetical protein [Pseudomonas sp. DVZ24]
MIESVSTSWVCAAQLHPVNESSDCAQVKTSESAQRLARHEEPQKHGILMRLFIAIAEFLGFRPGVATGGAQATASAPDMMRSLNEQMAKGLPDVMRSQASGILAKQENLPTEQFMASYTEQLTGSNIMRNANCLLSNVVKLGELVPELKVGTSITEVDIVGGYSLQEAQFPDNIKLMQNDPMAAAKVLDAVIFLASKFAEFPDPEQVGPEAVVAFVKEVDAEFIDLFAQKSDALAPVVVAQAYDDAASVVAGTLAEASPAQPVEPEASYGGATIGQPDPLTSLKDVKLGFVKIDDEVALPTRNDFNATMHSLQRPTSPLSQSFEHLERLAEHGSAAEKAIASMVLDHTAIGQTHSYGDLFGQRKLEPDLLQAHSALSFVDTLQKKLDMAGRLLGNLQAADAA